MVPNGSTVEWMRIGARETRFAERFACAICDRCDGCGLRRGVCEKCHGFHTPRTQKARPSWVVSGPLQSERAGLFLAVSRVVRASGDAWGQLEQPFGTREWLYVPFGMSFATRNGTSLLEPLWIPSTDRESCGDSSFSGCSFCVWSMIRSVLDFHPLLYRSVWPLVVDVGNVLLLLHSRTISCVPSHYKQTTNNKGEQR